MSSLVTSSGIPAHTSDTDSFWHRFSQLEDLTGTGSRRAWERKQRAMSTISGWCMKRFGPPLMRDLSISIAQGLCVCVYHVPSSEYHQELSSVAIWCSTRAGWLGHPVGNWMHLSIGKAARVHVLVGLLWRDARCLRQITVSVGWWREQIFYLWVMFSLHCLHIAHNTCFCVFVCASVLK